MDNKQKGNLAIASAIKHFVSIGYTVSIPHVLPSTGDNCSLTEESVGVNSSNSVKPPEDGNAEPNPSKG